MEKIKKIKTIVLGIMLVATALMAVIPIVSADSTHTEFEVMPYDFDVRKGDEFTVSIYVTPQDGKNIDSISTDLIEFHNITAETVSLGGIFTNEPGFPLYSLGTINNTGEYIENIFWSVGDAEVSTPGYFVNITFNSSAVGTGYINITECQVAFDGSSSGLPSSVTHNATIDIHYYIPGLPTTFTATSFNRTAVDLSWTKGTSFEADYTVVEYSTSPGPWARGVGTEIYNDTGNSYQHTGLTEGSDYYYQAWSYNETDNLYSTTNASDSATTDENQAPVQSNEDPTDDSGNIDKSYSQVSIDINDAEGDSFDYTIEGEYLTNTDVAGATNGTFTASLSTPLPYDTDIVWYVNVTDGTDWTNATYNFTVRSEFVPDEPTSFIAETQNTGQIDLSWNKGTNYAEKTVIECNSTGSWVEIYNDTGTSYQHTGLDPHSAYYYRAHSYNVTDNVLSASYVSANNLTDNTPPTEPTVSAPANGSNYESVYNQYFNVTVSDGDSDQLDVYFYWGNGTSIAFTTVNSGDTASIYLPDYIDPDWLEHKNDKTEGYSWYAVVNDTYTDGEVTGPTWYFNTSYAWDINEDGTVAVDDTSAMTSHYGEDGFVPGQYGWDINNDGDTDIQDVSALTSHYGEDYI
jgi:hypothetical protein